MAFFKYLIEIADDSVISNFKDILEEVGLNISEEFSSHSQIFAEERTEKLDYKSKVNVLISWSNKIKRECSVEVRSDEPYLKKDTRCETITSKLRKVIPPKEISALFLILLIN